MTKTGVPEIIYSKVLLCIYYIARSCKNICSFAPTHDVILCYHSVSDDNWRFSTPPQILKAQIKAIKRVGEIVTLHKLLTTQSKKARFAITFDDGYKNLFTEAKPVLDALGVHPCVFIIGNPAKRDLNELQNKLPLLTKSEIKLLAKHGWEIGYHTYSHADLRNAKKAQIEFEVNQSREKLESELGFKFRYFAYPRGLVTPDICQSVQGGNYAAAFTVNGGYADHKNVMLISRLPMEGKIDKRMFSAQITSLGIAASQIYMSLLETKEAIGHYLQRIFTI